MEKIPSKTTIEEELGKTSLNQSDEAPFKVPEKSVDRRKEEVNIEGHKKQEIQENKELEETKQRLGLEQNEDKESFIEIDALLKKLEIPFDDEGIDKQRQELLKETQEQTSRILNDLDKNKKTSLEINKKKEELEDKVKNLEILKADKEKEREILRKEAEEYIDKTNPPIIRKSTKEKLARAIGVIQYLEGIKQDEYKGDRSDFLNFNYSNYTYTAKSPGVHYAKNAKGGFGEGKEISDGIRKIALESHNVGLEIKIEEAGLRELNTDSEGKKSSLANLIEKQSTKLDWLKNAQVRVNENKEEERINKEILLSLLPEKNEGAKEKNPLIAEKMKVAQERAEENILKLLDDYFFSVRNGSLEKSGIHNKEEAVERLREEVKKVQESASITINFGPDGLLKRLASGKFKSTLEIPTKEQKERGSGKVAYESKRIDAEKNMGIYATGTEEDPYAIVGALANDNGHDEFNGGAGCYGEIFVKLRPETIDRSIFVNGDSLVENLLNENRGRQEPPPILDKETAFVAKAIRNITTGKDKSSPNHENGGKYRDYIEANILGGVTMEDIATINIKSPNTILKEYPSIEKEFSFRYKGHASHEYEWYTRSKNLIDQIKQKFPQYASLINEV